MFEYDAQGNKVRRENYATAQPKFHNAVEHYGSSKKKTKKWVWYTVGGVGVVVLVLVIWLLARRKSSSTSVQRFGFRFY